MEIISTIVIGLIVGAIAKLLMPGKQGGGFILTAVLGVAGSFLATYGGQMLGMYKAGQGAGFLASVVGALIVLVIYGFIRKKTA
jgi:uncharacterized membrane protein YeaQ/YmgE (transglycosylase-associated protein family)